MGRNSQLDILESDTFLLSKHQIGKAQRSYFCDVWIFSFSPTKKVVHSSTT